MAAERRHRHRPTPVWSLIAIGLLAAALVAVSIGFALQAQTASSNVKAVSKSATDLMNGLVSDVGTTNQQVKTLNGELETISSSAKSKAASAQQKGASSGGRRQ